MGIPWRVIAVAYFAASGLLSHVYLAISYVRFKREMADKKETIRRELHPEYGTSKWAHHNLLNDELWVDASPDDERTRRACILFNQSPQIMEMLRSGEAPPE